MGRAWKVNLPSALLKFLDPLLDLSTLERKQTESLVAGKNSPTLITLDKVKINGLQ